jgi:Putative peptidoglycan binding domain
MKTLLALICSFALISFASAAQPDKDQNNNPKGKKEKGAAVVQQQPIKGGGGTAGNARFKTQGTTTTRAAKFHTQGSARMIHDPTLNQSGGSLSSVQSGGNAAYKTKLGKTKLSSQTTVTGGTAQFQRRHFNLSNNPNPRYQAVRFNGNYRIRGAQNWSGSNYVVFRNYRSQWHDQGWWRSHNNRIIFFFGAPYYWDNGYAYPAWGYDPGANYYYDGPVYASSPDVDLGQEVANVQAALKEQGYYRGEIDGIIGPETRAALAEYQSAQGLEPTGTVDEPTMRMLGMV